jgi:hypothetical protein
MKILKQLISAVTLSILASTAVAQTETTGNLVYTTVNPAPPGAMPHSWTGFSIVNSTGGNTTSDNGAVTGYNPNTGTFMFGYNQGTIAYTYAINQALANSGSGIVVQGYNWSWDINNNNFDNRQGSTDTLTARIITFSPNNVDIRRTDTWTYNTRFDWTTFSGTVNYVNPGAPSEFGNMRIEFTGRDSGFWAGYYGPMVRNIDVRLRYGVDPCVTNPQSSPTCPGYKTFYNIPDDGYAIVPIPFGFPLYGQTFTHSLMFDNGVVSFYSPNAPMRLGGSQFYADPISGNLGSQFYYSIMPLWTDLYNYSGSLYTQQSNQHLKYTWENISQFGFPDRLNTFSLEIRPTGYIGLQYQNVNIIEYPVTIGMVGNAALGEYTQFYRQPDGAATSLSNVQSWSVNQTVATDCSNPLVNVNCPGYAQAYFDQQCSLNALHSPSCPGYAQAYFTQQCSLNTLYDPACPGYAQAFYNYQCSLNALYHTGCPGYAQAYFNQQCGLDPLYNSACPGYATAFYNLQCSLDALYDEGCPGYADAFYVQQCTISPLYDSGCTGYAQAFYDQQCSLDALYDKGCPGYAEAFAKKYILNIGSTAPVIAVEETKPVAVVAEAEPAKVEIKVEEKATVAATETREAAVSASPAAQATAPVSLAAAPAASPATASRTEARTEAPRTAAPARAAPTTRQAMAEQRMAAAREQAAQAARENPGETTAAMDSATSLEQQVEVQNVVLGAMSFVPGFDAYGRATIPDATGYPPFVIYPGQRNIDSPAARGLLGRSDRLHQEMVDAQYR